MKRIGLVVAVLVLAFLSYGSGTGDTASPILSWNTFLGGIGADETCNALTLDSGGNIYIVGYGNATWGSPIRAYAGNNYDAFVAKLKPDGTLVWNTFLGGDWNDFGYAIGLDGYGNIYVSGQSNSTWGTPVRAFATAPDIFVAKLDPSGTLIWNTFLGGSGSDSNNSMAVDPGGNCYAVGASNATWGSPVNPFVAIPAGYKDFSIAKVDSNGYLQWNTFLGGTANDTAFGVAADVYGKVYVAGASRATWGSPKNPYTGAGTNDITVAQVNAGDGVLQWNTFYGQAGDDYAYGIAVSPDDIVLVAGWSTATWGTPINPYAGGGSDGLVMALELDGDFLGHTFIGGTGDDGCTSVCGDKAGSIYLSGFSTASWGSPDKPFVGGGTYSTDGFVVRLGATGSFQALTFVGGAGDDSCNALALDSNRNFLAVGQSSATWGSPIRAFGTATDGFVAKSTFIPNFLSRDAVGDFDGDGTDEAVLNFGTLGIWMYNNGAWSQIKDGFAEEMLALNIDGDADDEIVADMGDGGLWLWNDWTLSKISGNDAEGLAVGDLDSSGDEEFLADFGTAGLWIYDLGHWTQFSGANPDFMVFAQLNGTGWQEIVADFGAIGLWVRQGTAWFQISGVNADFFACGDTDGNGTAEIVGDFGATGLWLWNTGSWTQLSGVDVNYLIMADTNADNKAEIIGDFGPVGLWLWASGSWTMLSGVREEFMIAANVDADPVKEVFVDFGPLGLWECDGGSWIQFSGVNPEYMISGDFDGDGQAELMVDFGTLGLWLYNGGAWTQVSNVNPD